VVVHATLRIRHRGCVSEGFRDGVALAQVSGERGSDLYVLEAPDAAALERAQSAIEDFVGTPVEVVQRSHTALVYRHHNPPQGTLATIAGSGCHILWPAVWRDGEESFTFLAEDREALRRLLPKLEAMGTVHVERLSEVGPEGLPLTVPVADLTSALTARQLEVLQRAVERGYYDTPRGVTTAELAAAFGVGPSTLKEHLRKAERTVLHRLGALLAEHPPLARGATKGPGRPPRPRRGSGQSAGRGR
jgi:predicted DNA binding protein